jgi:hypothetical protein
MYATPKKPSPKLSQPAAGGIKGSWEKAWSLHPISSGPCDNVSPVLGRHRDMEGRLRKINLEGQYGLSEISELTVKSQNFEELR